MSKTRIKTGSDGRHAFRDVDGSDLEKKNLIRSVKQHIAGWQRDV